MVPKKLGWSVAFLMLLALVAGACAPAATPTPAPATQPPQPTPPPPTPTPAPKTLVVCMAQEPASLYLYSEAMLVKSHVLEAIMDGPIDSRTFAYQPVILEKLPSIKDGDAVVEEVEVQEGTYPIADAAGNVVTLTKGVTVKVLVDPKTGKTEDRTFEGGSIKLPVMKVTFKIKEGVLWSDGQPVTAEDSVFSFEVAKAPETKVSKFTIERTAEYKALDARTTQWVGIPGWIDATYFTNFWTPLPKHKYGKLTPAQMNEDPDVNRNPLGWGAFMMKEWVAGDHITVVKNPNYWRAKEGLPRIDTVIFRIVQDTNQLLAQLLSGDCDIGTQDAAFDAQAEFLKQAEAEGLLKPQFVLGTAFEHLDFNIQPAPGYQIAAGNDVFQDKRVRQAFAYCIDRKAIIDKVLFGRSEAPAVYMPSIHPLYAKDVVTVYEFNPEKGRALLEEAGWKDTDGDGIRDKGGKKFSVTYGTTAGNRLREQVTQIIQKQLKDNCQIEVNLYYKPAREFFANWPDGPVLGRKFDLAEFAWLTGVEPPCELYKTDQIPSDENPGGQNNTGYSNPAYDEACNRALGTLDPDEKKKWHAEAQRIFSEDLPALPLFVRLKIAVASPKVKNFIVDPTANSEMWNIEEFDIEQ
jgi:peptide/nickel transport system substrate-binding protein